MGVVTAPINANTNPGTTIGFVVHQKSSVEYTIRSTWPPGPVRPNPTSYSRRLWRPACLNRKICQT